MKKENKVQCAECQLPTPERACMTPGGKSFEGLSDPWQKNAC